VSNPILPWLGADLVPDAPLAWCLGASKVTVTPRASSEAHTGAGRPCSWHWPDLGHATLSSQESYWSGSHTKMPTPCSRNGRRKARHE